MKTPERIVSLISSATEILYLLGLGDRVVGVSHECDFPPEVATKPRLTRSLVDSIASSSAIDSQVRSLSASGAALYAIDVEQLAGLRPDLIVTQAQCDVCAVRYEDVAAAVRDTPPLRNAQILALNPRSLLDVFDDIARIGQSTASQAAAREIIGRLRARVDAVRATTVSLAPSQIPRTACLEWIDPPMLAANWTPELVQMAGGQPGLTVVGQHSIYTPWDQIVQYDPQVVVIMSCGFDLERAIVEAQELPTLPGWVALSAVRDRRVFAVDGNAYFNRSGPRLVDSLEILSHLFHPEWFAPPWTEPQQAWRRLETRGGALEPEQP
jgi:iron complex transport system substrate-binding protein